MKNDNTILFLGLGALALGGFYLISQNKNTNTNTNPAPQTNPVTTYNPIPNPLGLPITTSTGGGTGFNSGFGTQQAVANGWNLAQGLAGAAGDIITALINKGK